MNVAVNARLKGGTGIARYSKGLLSALASGPPGRLVLSTFALGKRDPCPAWLPPSVHHCTAQLPGRVQRLLHDTLGVPVETLFGLRGCDLIHDHDLGLLNARRKVVRTVHDVAWRSMGEVYTSVVSKEWIAAAERAITDADHICSVSDATRDELVRSGVAPRKITVTRLGVDRRFSPPDSSDVRRVRGKYDLSDEFVLYMGAINVRKNVAVLVSALADMASPPTLVLVGPNGHEMAGIGRSDEVCHRHLGFVEDADLAALLGGASALVFPSLIEGFGLPLLEAMAVGVPVVASDIPVFREVGGDAPFYFDPSDGRALAAHLERLLGDSDLRGERGERGQALAAAYTWPECAASTMEAYETAMRT